MTLAGRSVPAHPAAHQPLSDLTAVDALGDDLRSAGYRASAVPELLGDSANRALGRGELFGALRATRGGTPVETAVRLFLLGVTEPESAVAAALPRLGVDGALAAGVLTRHGTGVACGAGHPAARR